MVYFKILLKTNKLFKKLSKNIPVTCGKSNSNSSDHLCISSPMKIHHYPREKNLKKVSTHWIRIEQLKGYLLLFPQL